VSKYAENEHGKLYVQVTSSWGQAKERLVLADSLKDAKAKFGWTRQQHASVAVRRATVEDYARIQGDRPFYADVARQR
jgi:hypothetical protein